MTSSNSAFLTACILLGMFTSVLTGGLTILGAAYGPADVTKQVQGLVANGALSVKAENSVFGDSWVGTQKSLVVVFRYASNLKTYVLAVAEHQQLDIQLSGPWFECGTGTDGGILGAAYGLADVTQLAKKAASNSAAVVASNQVFGDSWPYVVKTLVIVYQSCKGSPKVVIRTEGNQVDSSSLLPPQNLNIIKATYGTADVANAVKGLTKNQGGKSLTVEASNSVFGDPNPGVVKTLTITYQYGNCASETVNVQEHESVSIARQDPSAPAFLLKKSALRSKHAQCGKHEETI